MAYSCHCASIQSRSHSTFFFCMEPLTNDGGHGWYLLVSKIGPLWGPNSEDLAGFKPPWVGRNSGKAERPKAEIAKRLTADDPLWTLGLLLDDYMVSLGVRINLWGRILMAVWVKVSSSPII